MDSMLDDGDRWAATVPALYPDMPEEAFRYRCFGAADDEEADRYGDDADYVLCKRPRVVRVSPKPCLIPRRVTCPEEIARRQLEALSWLHRGVSPNLVRAKVDGDARLGVLPSVAVLHTLAKAYVKEGKHRAAGSILQEMATSGLGPRPNTFRVLLNTLLEPLLRFDQGNHSNISPRGVVEACSSILAARREEDVPALHTTTTTVAGWIDWCERVLEAARVVLVGARAMEEVASLESTTRDGRPCVGAKGARTTTMATSAAVILPGGIINLVYWELSCLVLHTPPGSTPQLQTKLFDMTGLVLSALITAHGEVDSAAYNQRYLGVCMKAGRFAQACSLLQSSSTLSTAVVADFLSMCTAHCITQSREEEGWSVDATGTTVVTWERILTQLRLDVINLPPDTLLKAIAISYAPLTMDGIAATPHQLALLAATVIAWSQHPQAHSPVSIQVVYRIVMLACLRYSHTTCPDVPPDVATTLEDLTKLCLPGASGTTPLEILLSWLEANVDRVAAALGDAKVPQFTPCVSITEICSLVDESSSLPLVTSTRLAVRQLCTWLPEYWRYYLQGAKDHHRPTLHGSQGILRPGSAATSGLPAGLGGLLDQLLLHPAFKRDMLVPISSSAPNISIPARRLVHVLPQLPLDAQGPILANLQACHHVWLRSIMWGAMLRLSSGAKPPTPEVCKDYGVELDGLISKYIGSVEVGRGGLAPEDIAAMVTVSRVEGSAASSSSFYVMVPDTHALEQLACAPATVSPPFKEQHELLVRSQHRRAPQPTAATHSLIPQVPLSPAMEAFSGLMRKYSVATGAVLAVPFGALAGLSDLGVYGLIQLLKVKKVVWVTVLPLGISTITAPTLPSISQVISTLPPQSDDGSAWVAGMCASGGCAKSALLTGVSTLPAQLKEAALFTPAPAVIHLGDILTKLGVVVPTSTN